jgi:ribosomal protein L17
LGKEPNLLQLLSNWIQALDDYNFKPTTVDAASEHLRTLLSSKAILLVVDDAWEEEHIKPFLVGGQNCQLLITTRRPDIALQVGAELYQLNLMTEEQSLTLLEKVLAPAKLEEKQREEAKRIAKAVGYLPYALDLVAKRIKSGTSWKDLLDAFNTEVARLEKLDTARKRSKGEISLEALFNKSLEALQEYKPELKENFNWLGVLQEDVSIAAPMMTTLWEVEIEEANDRLELLRDESLLLPGSPVIIGDKEWHTYRVHDILHDIACRRLSKKQAQAQKDSLAESHAAFLKRYQTKTQNGKWHSLENDGYIYSYLTWHLEKAGLVDEIHSLLREDSKTRSNGWYEACDRLGQTVNFVTDVARAWQLAEADWTETTLPQVIGLQCRYALIIASLNSLAANLPVELLIALVQKNVWTPEQGLGYVLQSSNSAQKANLVTQLADHLPSNLKELALSKALAAAREIEDESSRAKALSSLADKLPELLLEALAAAREIQDESSRANALSSLAPLLPELLPEALAAVKEIQDESSRASALSSLADKLPRDLLPEALAAAREIQSESDRADVLSSLAPLLPELLPEALAVARSIQDASARTYALDSLADKLPELLPEALAAAREIENEYSRAHALSSLADKLPSNLLLEALAATRSIQDEEYRAKALVPLADKLPNLLPEALAAAREIQDKTDRAKALILLADKLPDLLPEALAAARSIQDASDRAKALSSLADKLSQIQKTPLFAHWRDTLHILSVHTRPNLLSDISALTPVIFTLGGKEAVKDTASAIQDVSRWWG